MEDLNLHYTLYDIFESEQTLPFQSMVNIHAIKFYYMLADPFINSSASRRTPGVVFIARHSIGNETLGKVE